MWSETDKTYYYQRAEVELRRASETSCPEAVKAHYQLAGHYLDKVYGEMKPKGSSGVERFCQNQ